MNLSDAAQFAERWAENQRGMVAVAETLRDLGSMEQATKERRAALDAATKEHEAKKAEMATAEAALAKTKDQHAAEAHRQSAALAQMTTDAKAQADRLVADAKASAASMIEAARAEVDATQRAHASKIVATNKDLEAARADLAAVRKAIAESEGQHAELTPKIEALRATARLLANA